MSALKNMPVSFPGLFGEWAWNPDPVAIHIGHGIYWYGIIITVVMLAALWICTRQSSHYGLTKNQIMDLVLWGIPCGILGARIYYVVFHADLFQSPDGSLDFRKAIAIWDGGLAIYGGIIAGILVAFFYARHKKIRFGALTDLSVLGLLLGQSIGRWANFINREAFGAETALPWRMRLWISQSEYIEVHPTFFYESVWNLAGLLILIFIISKNRKFDGENTLFYFLWYGLGRFWIEGLRADSLYLFDWTWFGEPIRVSQALSLALMIISGILLIYHLKVRPHKKDELWSHQTEKPI